jgi:hypothetical protein
MNAIDHTIARNRAHMRALIAISDAITASPSQIAVVPQSALPPPAGATLSPRELREIHDSFLAPGPFDALETYGDPPKPAPTLAETIAAGRHAREWHQARVGELNGAYHRARVRAIAAIVTRLEAFL